MRTTAFYAETISGTTEMQLPFEGGGKCLTACSSADNGWGQEGENMRKEKVKKGRTYQFEQFYSYRCEKNAVINTWD